MKKLFSFLMAISFMASVYAATSPTASANLTPKPAAGTPVMNANEILLPVGNTGKSISLMALSEISVKDFETISGKKLSAFDKVGFKLGQRKLRNKIEADGTIKDKVIKKYAAKIAAEGETGFHVGGFALGFLLGLIGVLVAYLINDGKKSNRVKWAWIGLGVVVVIYLLAAVL